MSRLKTMTVNLKEKDYKLAISLATRLQIKEDWGKNIEEIDFGNEHEVYKVMHSALKATNDDFKLTLKEFLRSASMFIIADFGELMKADEPADEPDTTLKDDSSGNLTAAKA